MCLNVLEWGAGEAFEQGKWLILRPSSPLSLLATLSRTILEFWRRCPAGTMPMLGETDSRDFQARALGVQASVRRIPPRRVGRLRKTHGRHLFLLVRNARRGPATDNTKHEDCTTLSSRDHMGSHTDHADRLRKLVPATDTTDCAGFRLRVMPQRAKSGRGGRRDTCMRMTSSADRFTKACTPEYPQP